MGASGTEFDAEYGADQIQILEGLEAVRKRPGMYIGSTSVRGLHHLVYEIVDNAVDEALAGYCDKIQVDINKDNSITVTDNGRGIPVGINHKAGLPAVEVVFTILHAGGKFGGGGYKVSGGLHGVGASVVNALSEWLEVEIANEGKIYKQRYERGKVCYKLRVDRECEPEMRGTKVTFLPDKEIFEETVFDYNTLKQRFREMAFLTKGLKIHLRDLREEEIHEHIFHYEGGIKEFVTYLNKSKTALYEQIIYCEGMKDNVAVEVAMQHNDSYTENIYTFVNNKLNESDQRSYAKVESTVTYQGMMKKKGEDVEVNLTLKSKKDTEVDASKDGHSLEERIEHIRDIVSSFRGSTFIKSLKESSPVRSPIRKTNVILKEQNFIKALELWEYLEKNNIKPVTSIDKRSEVIKSGDIKTKYDLAFFINTDAIDINKTSNKSEYNSAIVSKLVNDFVFTGNITEKEFKKLMEKEFKEAKKRKDKATIGIKKTIEDFLDNYNNNKKKIISIIK